MADVTEDICADVSKGLIEDVLKNYYGFINGKIKQLDGYDDKNFHITVCIIYLYTVPIQKRLSYHRFRDCDK